MRVLITRAENEAAGMAAKLKEEGFDPLVASMLDIKLSEKPVDYKGIQGVVVTSANAARALAQMSEVRDIKLFCIGPQTEKKAQELGFTNTLASLGNLNNLVVFMQKNADPKAGPILYAHGENVTGTPVQDLRKAGFKTGAIRTYGAAPATELSEEAKAAFETGPLPDVVTLFSIRTFKIFMEVMKSEGLTGKLKDITAVCISPAVADFARGVRWKKVVAADETSVLSVLDALKGLRDANG